MRQLKPLLLLLAALLLGTLLWQRPSSIATGPVLSSVGEVSTLPAYLPPQAQVTLQRIARGGPFTHRQDGAVFGNYEGHLPRQPRGYYHEYTVETPGAHDRGARRIITGGVPPQVYYYTDDHYRSFRRFRMEP